MADMAKFVRQCSGYTPHYCAYMEELIRRLERILGDWLSVREATALVHILMWEVFQFDDGLVYMNDPNMAYQTFGRLDACVVASCFVQGDDVTDDEVLFCFDFFEAIKDYSDPHWKDIDEMTARIMAAPGVQLFRDPHQPPYYNPISRWYRGLNA